MDSPMPADALAAEEPMADDPEEGASAARSRPWTEAENQKLRDAIEQFGEKNWKKVRSAVVVPHDQYDQARAL